MTNIEATAGAQFSGSKLIWELGTLEPNTSKNVRVSYTPTREGELMATATATAYCAEPVTDSSRTAITGIAAARLDVIDLEDPVEVGTNTTYVITVSNEGSAADSNVRITRGARRQAPVRLVRQAPRPARSWARRSPSHRFATWIPRARRRGASWSRAPWPAT